MVLFKKYKNKEDFKENLFPKKLKITSKFSNYNDEYLLFFNNDFKHHEFVFSYDEKMNIFVADNVGIDSAFMDNLKDTGIVFTIKREKRFIIAQLL